MSDRRWCGLVGLAAVSLTTPLLSLVGVGADLTAANRYVWRGVTRSQGWVVQPSAFLATGGVRDSLRAGAWMNFDLKGRRADQLSDRGPGRAGLTETNVWVQYQRDWESVSLAAGGIGYRFRDDGPLARRNRSWNTTELYASVQARGWRPSLRLDAWWDFDRVQGGYFEASTGVPVLGNIEGKPFWAVYLRALAGYSAGQERNRGGATEMAYFASPGLTHVLLSASTNIAIPRVKIRQVGEGAALLFDAYAQFNRDRATKVTDAAVPPDEKRVKLWISFSASVPAMRLF